MDKKLKQLEIGPFLVSSGALMVSDPCYQLTPDCQILLDGARNGTWSGTVIKGGEGTWGERVWELIAISDGAPFSSWEEFPRDLGVDSGQMAICDRKQFRSASDAWYELCCETTSGADAGAIPGGVVSSSGYGDGSYPCFVMRDGNEIVGVRVVFILPNDEGDE